MIKMGDNVARSENKGPETEPDLKATRRRVSNLMQNQLKYNQEIKGRILMATVGIGAMPGAKRQAGIDWLNGICTKLEGRCRHETGAM